MTQPFTSAERLAWAKNEPLAAKALARNARAAHALLARRDFHTFVEFVMRDEITGQLVKMSPMHDAWEQLANENDRLIIWSHVDAGKTQQLSIARTLFELGNNHNLRFVIVSSTGLLAKKIVSIISRYIDESAELREVFPDLRPDKVTGWTDTAIFVQRESVMAKDPSVQAFGVHGKALGSRTDRLICDDILSWENVHTDEQREQLWSWYHSALVGRLTEHARVLFVGNAFHPQDMLHRLGAKQGWVAVRYPVMDETGTPRWPEHWSSVRIAVAQLDLGPLEFARQMLCVARDDATARFKQAWIDNALVRGEGKTLAYGLAAVPAGYRTFTGVDLAVQRGAKNDLTVMFSIAIHPDGSREVLWIDAGRWSGPDIVSRIIDHCHRYQSIGIVENNAAQDFILQFVVDRSAVPVLPFTTGKNKATPEFGIESLAVELYNSKWIFPNEMVNGKRVVPPEIMALIGELLRYAPDAHTGDRLMAMWFAREGERMFQPEETLLTGRIDTMSR